MVINSVYPIIALYAGPLALLVYYTIGRRSTKKVMMHAKRQNIKPPGKKKPFWQRVVTRALHCGSGSTIGDILDETI